MILLPKRPQLKEIIPLSLHPDHLDNVKEVPLKVGGVNRVLQVSEPGRCRLVGAFKAAVKGKETLMEVRKEDTGAGVELWVYDAGKRIPLIIGNFIASSDKGLLEIYHRRVNRPYRRLGLATEVFNLLERHFSTKGSARAMALTQEKSALLFLLARGYAPVKEHKEYVKKIKAGPQQFREKLAREVWLYKPLSPPSMH